MLLYRMPSEAFRGIRLGAPPWRFCMICIPRHGYPLKVVCIGEAAMSDACHELLKT